MSPAALALAIGLHGAVAAALWWAVPTRRFDHAETPIMVSIEPQPASAGTAAAPTSPMSVASPAAEAIPTESAQTEAKRVEPAPPEAETTPEPPQQAALAPVAPEPAVPRPVEPTPAPPPSRRVEPSPAPAPVPTPAPPSEQVAEPAPAPAETATAAPEPPTAAEAEAAWQTDASSWKPQVTLEQSPAPPPRPVRPPTRPPTAPRTAQAPGTRLQDYPPQTSSLGGPSTSSFDSAMGDGGARNDYLSRVYRHIDPYRDYPAAARAARQHGRVVTRVTISRAGELLDIRLDRSSGWPLIDNAEMAAIRRAMPLPPVPDGMRGDPIVLVLPMNY